MKEKPKIEQPCANNFSKCKSPINDTKDNVKNHRTQTIYPNFIPI